MAKNKPSDQDKKEKNQPVSKPDPETLHTTDPQEKMKGPISSLLNETRKDIEQHGGEHVDEGDKK